MTVKVAITYGPAHFSYGLIQFLGLSPMSIDDVCDSLKGRGEHFRATIITLWRKRLPPSVIDKMLQSRKEAESLLYDPDWNVRCAAFSFLQHYWKAACRVDFARKCEEIGLQDVHPQVRSIALTTLGICHENTDDVRVGKLLAQVVLDDSQPPEARRGAYFGLHYLREPILRWPTMKRLPAVDLVPEDFDWSFVKSFCDR